jgi:hypothetical protein
VPAGAFAVVSDATVGGNRDVVETHRDRGRRGTGESHLAFGVRDVQSAFVGGAVVAVMAAIQSGDVGATSGLAPSPPSR